MSKVFCPYCGGEMRHVATKWSDAEWYECKDCHSRSPSANCMKVKEAALTRKDSPVVHAWWEMGIPVTCSVCGNPAAQVDSLSFWVSDYCPNCGAKMDGGAT